MLAWSIRPLSQSELTVTFLDVGHGGAVLFQFPGGETALFDAGSFGRAEAAEHTIHRALLSRRITGLNALDPVACRFGPLQRGRRIDSANAGGSGVRFAGISRYVAGERIGGVRIHCETGGASAIPPGG